ncbi:hypothetical protein COV06_03250 [Candidatus Uhrbacteria bacterium CG10_big_fil_rev_8_21_14_0_10_50_16]|uniref:Uncharacterized protein n=1 Tax=Candidatus Uhrbacteria bacterium CG10_big_fil_rev_8_21_14_0_10_50_16 TaxID=1975039 RepID=A0A2H0RLM9_9BACT|nr:MAG: hypothetical protein COV06_03250 [Candidatus Uhrbacteria bacterium CG10_big_fil_rev_8_21_14_0_10_50_16]
MKPDISKAHELFLFLLQVASTASNEFEIREQLRTAGFPNPEVVSIEIVSRDPDTNQPRFRIIAQTPFEGVVHV